MTPGHRNCSNNNASKNYWKNRGLEYAEQKLDTLSHEYLKMHDIVAELRKEQGDEKDEIPSCAEFSEKDVVNHPSHYETGKFECIEVMEEVMGTEAVKDFCISNAFKYLYRHKRKNGLEDIKKAKWYLDRYIKLSEGEDK